MSEQVMTIRGICPHGKVRFMAVDAPGVIDAQVKREIADMVAHYDNTPTFEECVAYLRRAYELGQRAENAACAQIADDFKDVENSPYGMEFVESSTDKELAAAIRGRMEES